MSKTLWLSRNVLSWVAEFDTGRHSDLERVNRPHHLLSHSERQLNTAQDEFIRADVVLNLKRSISSRLQHLEDLYEFSKAFPKSVGALERLEAVGLARPLLIRQLFSLRNDIEHNDVAPPDEQKCCELADSTWYFLKTTDYACKLVPSGVMLSNPSSPTTGNTLESITFKVTTGSAEIELNGRLSPETLSEIERPGFMAVREESTYIGDLAKSIVLSRAGKSPGPESASNGSRMFSGRATAPNDVKQKLWKRMLETL